MIASVPTGANEWCEWQVPDKLKPLYKKKNGFFAFESALEVFPSGLSRESYSLSEWNNESTWLSFYKELRPPGVLFAQGALGDQFLFNDGFHSFDPETGEVSYLGNSIESWAKQILDNYEILTGQPVAHEWQSQKGRIPFRKRLVPITPFVLGGAFETDNLIVMDAVAGMRLRANLALQIKNLPDGANVYYEITP